MEYPTVSGITSYFLLVLFLVKFFVDVQYLCWVVIPDQKLGVEFSSRCQFPIIKSHNA